MKFCSKCGKELYDEAVVCTGCGCPIGGNANTTAEETPTLATLGIVFGFLMPLIGLILGIAGVCKYKRDDYKKKSTSAICISIGMWIFYACILLLV